MTTFELIDNIKNEIENVKGAISDKGVDVPAAAKLEDLPALITTIESGGSGSEDWKIDCCAYLFGETAGNKDNKENFNNIIKHISKPTTLTYMCENKSVTTGWLTKEMLNKIINTDLSECTNLSYAFNFNGYELNGDFLFNLSKCTNLSYTFRSLNKGQTQLEDNEGIILDFNGSTSNVTNMMNSFIGYTTSSYNKGAKIREIKNLNMDKVTSCNYMIGYNDNLRRLTFSGSFGGKSTTATLTLDFTYGMSGGCVLDHDGIVEMFNSLSNNINGKTRIFKVNQDVYDSLTNEEIEIATSKGYTISY